MRKQRRSTKTKPIPRTNIRWRSREQYDRVKQAAGNIPVSTFCLDLVVRTVDKREVA